VKCRSAASDQLLDTQFWHSSWSSANVDLALST
jgi:hypothetical protein